MQPTAGKMIKDRDTKLSRLKMLKQTKKIFIYPRQHQPALSPTACVLCGKFQSTMPCITCASIRISTYSKGL
ncbi:MAG TPA: hypothetical protein DDW91_11875 [Shewanella frigidimarina]|mgnify:FL=1|nr:hypothetical protein [Shewanella frigidimarina]|tara:strand:- start:208920 stop:209135 length:216 start_codon:yes stop_codon:yes gene_type:complete